MQVIVEDLLTDNVYTFEIQEELIRNRECDSWKEIPVKVDTLTKTTGSEQQVRDDDYGQKQHHDVSDAAAGGVVAANAAEPTQAQQSESQLSGKSDCHYLATVFVSA